MKMFRYWEVLEDHVRSGDGKPFLLRAWGGSDTDREDALAAAAARMAQMQERVAARTGLKPAAQYEYATGVLREERLALLAGSDAQPEAVLTRNRYGAPVLCARRLFIADIDFPEPKPTWKFWEKPADPAIEALAGVRGWAEEHDASVRVYRTPHGLRVLRIDRAVDAESDAARHDLDALSNDPLYRALCRRQQCFRARLGPKPWRMGMANPPGQFPRSDADAARFAEWLAQYEETARGFAACRFEVAIGGAVPAVELTALVAAHDEGSGALSGRPLA